MTESVDNLDSYYASVQSSELKAVLPASKMPTTSQSVRAKWSVSPCCPPLILSEVLFPAITSRDPGFGYRPATSLTCGLSALDCGSTPLMTTLVGFLVPFFERVTSTSVWCPLGSVKTFKSRYGIHPCLVRPIRRCEGGTLMKLVFSPLPRERERVG